jgi:hypothetical protein
MEGDARRLSYQALGRGVPVRAAGGSLHDWFGGPFGRAHWKRDD